MSRPKGGLGNPFGIRKKRPWNPLKWRVDHEAVVLFHVQGKSNKEIAVMFSKSEMWVSMVINSEQAHILIEKIRSNLPHREMMDRYNGILMKAVERMETFIGDDDLATRQPGAMVDRAMRMAEMIDKRLSNVIKEKETERITERTIVLASEESVNRMLEALGKSQQVTEIHRKEIKLLKDNNMNESSTGTDG